ncbi:hypothetical protein GW17_00044392, partial [Ensete ventricosum]
GGHPRPGRLQRQLATTKAPCKGAIGCPQAVVAPWQGNCRRARVVASYAGATATAQ